MRFRDLLPVATARGAALQLDEISDLAALDAAAWSALVASSPDGTVFQSLDWLLSWWDAFGGRRTPLILIARQETELVGAAPLLIDDTCKRPCIRFIGENHADYLTFLASNGAAEVVEQLLQHLERGYGARYDLHLVDVPDTSTLALLLERRKRLIPSRLLRTTVTPCPRLKIRGNKRQVDEALRKKSLKRHAAKLAAQGALEVRHLSDAPQILLQLEQFFEQHRRRWAVTPFPSLFEAEANRRFYRNLVRSTLCNGSLLLTTVSVGGRLAACHFGLISRTDFIWYKPSFDVTLSRLSPGEVLLGQLLSLASERGFEHFDFTRGDEAFKSRFSSEFRHNSSYVLYASRLDALAVHTRSFAKSVLQRSLSQGSPAGRFLRQVKHTFGTARQAGASSPRAVLASVWRAGDPLRQWLISRRTVHLFSAQESPPRDAIEVGLVHEASLEFLLDRSDRLAEVLALDKQFLREAHKRLARGERCFVIEAQERVVAVGWVSSHSPHRVTEIEAALRFPRQAVVLYDFQIAQAFRRQGLYPKLLLGIRSALGAVPALIYAEDSNISSLEGIRRAGFTLEAAIENRILSGHRRLTSRLSCPQTIPWEIHQQAS